MLFRFVAQYAGDQSAVNWILHDHEGDVHQAVLMMTNMTNQYAVLWHAEVAPAARDSVREDYLQLARRQKVAQELSFDSNTTLVKRLRTVRDRLPTLSRNSKAWLD